MKQIGSILLFIFFAPAIFVGIVIIVLINLLGGIFGRSFPEYSEWRN